MARIAGIDLPKDKRVEIGLTYIYGIGRTSANKILAEAGINPDTRVKDLTEADEAKLREIISHSYTVEGDLRRDVAMDIKRLTEKMCIRDRDNAKVLEAVVGDLTKITGQKAIITKAKKSVANFKLREGMPIGAKVRCV